MLHINFIDVFPLVVVLYDVFFDDVGRMLEGRIEITFKLTMLHVIRV